MAKDIKLYKDGHEVSINETQLENFKLSSLDSINKLNTSINNLSNKNVPIHQ